MNGPFAGCTEGSGGVAKVHVTWEINPTASAVTLKCSFNVTADRFSSITWMKDRKQIFIQTINTKFEQGGQPNIIRQSYLYLAPERSWAVSQQHLTLNLVPSITDQYCCLVRDAEKQQYSGDIVVQMKGM